MLWLWIISTHVPVLIPLQTDSNERPPPEAPEMRRREVSPSPRSLCHAVLQLHFSSKFFPQQSPRDACVHTDATLSQPGALLEPTHPSPFTMTPTPE